MLHKHKLAIALGLLAVLGAVEVAQARMKFFPGTRSQVKSACHGPGRSLTEGTGILGIGWSLCMDSNTNIGVVCDDGGGCIGTGGGLTRFAGPTRGPRGNHQPPESLSEQSSSGEVPYDAPPVNPDTDVVIFN